MLEDVRVNVSVKLEQNWNKMRTNENKLEHDNLWLCVACLLLETVGQVSRNASGWNLYVVKLPKSWNERNEQK